MRRRVDIVIDRVAVEDSLSRNPAALKAAIEQAVAVRLRAPGALDRLSPGRTGHVDGGTTPGRGGLGAVAKAVAAAATRGESS
ncbi:MAG TPA: hypothetical protein VEA61_12580 [Allosphingosinicella sp.]|nr:hypothetical protein [Allosphingosinicella sp.]